MIAAGHHRPRVAPALAQKLSRLAASAHRYHRFAHHPLCDAYAHEVLRLGKRRRLCAGCTWTGLGGALGACLGLATPPTAVALIALVGLQLVGLGWLFWACYGHARPYKWLLRGGPMACSAWGLLGVLRHLTAAPWQFWVWIVEAALGVAAVAALRAYRRRVPWRLPCGTCPQHRDAVCDGFRPVVRRERALHRLSGRLLQCSELQALTSGQAPSHSPLEYVHQPER